MKKLILFFAFSIIFFQAFSQVPISQMPTRTGNPNGAWVPIVIGSTNYKTDAANFGWDKMDSAYVRNDSIFGTNKRHAHEFFIGKLLSGTGGSGIGQVIAGWGLLNTDDSTVILDSATVATYFVRRNDSSVAGGYYPYSTNPKSYLVPADTANKWLGSAYKRADSFFYKIGTTEYFIGTDSAGIGSFLQDGLIYGGIVTHAGGLDLDVTAAQYRIQGVIYNSAAGQVTLTTADVTDPRYDVIAVDNTGSIVVITGDPDPNPTIPQIDPATQVYLTAIYVPAGATDLSTPDEIIYDENTENWTGAATGVTVSFSNTTSPYHLTKSADVGSWTAGQQINFTKNTGTLVATDYTAFKCFILLKSAIAGTANIRVSFLNGSTVVSSVITLASTYGFSKSNSSTDQNISIPVSAFTFSSTTFNKIRFTLAGTGGGMYLDWVQLQAGTGTITTETDPIATAKTVTVTGSTDVGVTGSTQTINSNPAFALGNVVGIRGNAVPSLSSGVLRWNGSSWIFDNTVASTSLTNTHIFVGNGSNVAADVAMSGDIAITNAGVTSIGANKVLDAMIRQSAGLSVIGRSASSTGDVADITGTANQVLRVSGTTLGFGTLDSAYLASGFHTQGYYDLRYLQSLQALTVGTNLQLSSGTTYDGTVAKTISLQNAAADGSTKGAASFTANDFDASSGNVSLDYTNGQKANSSQPGFETSNQTIGTIGDSENGQGTYISSGSKGFITIPYNCTITNWYVSASASGSIQFDVKRSGTSIIGGSGNKPALSSQQSANAAVSNWTSTSVTAGDILEFVVDSSPSPSVTQCTVVLKVIK